MKSGHRIRAGGDQIARVRLDLTGAIQGVGFRPFVHRLASAEHLSGFVRNTGDGVSIEVEGAHSALERFLSRLDKELPPRAVVFRRCSAPLTPRGDQNFVVAPSTQVSTGPAVVMADLATCPDCLREILDPADRRYAYAFTSCMHCGPRYSIIEALPYDRARTTMRHFPLCAACQSEYADPGCRRFQAEPIACPDCGPCLALWNAAGEVMATGHQALLEVAEALRRGLIVALKGLGGFQLFVDAGNEAAVNRLRQRKRRPEKPFALMLPTVDAALRMAHASEIEQRLLLSPEAPIVLMRAPSRNSGLCRAVAPDNPSLGIMLPYTPLHHLLLRELDCPVVATSGNLGDEPIVADETEALKRLGGIAECFLVHDRAIRRPVDDSVVRVMAGQVVILRRARGYAPMPLAYDAVTGPILGLGGQQKNAVATGFAGQLFLGPHLGDLTAARTRDRFARMAAELPELHRITLGSVACDTHPGYHTTGVAEASGLPVTRVPHHLAHVLSCMVDNGLDRPVLGVAWDGTGDGGDGTIWGGEFLTVDAEHYRRIAHLRPFRLPGGEAAVREPRRAALGLLYEIYGPDVLTNTRLRPVDAFTAQERDVLRTMLCRGFNAPFTSSAGRLFDAVSAILGICQVNSFEGEAAMGLEFAASRARDIIALPPFVVRETKGPLMVDWMPPVAALLDKFQRGAAPEPLSAALHEGLSGAIVDIARRAGRRHVVLTGGCFQNARLTERTVELLGAGGFVPHFHHRIPPNDGGLSVGQVVFAARPLVEEKA
jgi:hydrogenase maturation protein HypF